MRPELTAKHRKGLNNIKLNNKNRNNSKIFNEDEHRFDNLMNKNKRIQKKSGKKQQKYETFKQKQQRQQSQQNEDESRQIIWKQQSQDQDISQQKDSHNLAEDQQNEQEDGQQQQGPIVQHERDLHEYQQQIGNRGVVYMSRIPPYMTPNYIRKLLQDSQVQRIYLLPQSQWVRNNRIKHGGSKRICFRQGWIQFNDKKQAKRVALTMNGQKMVNKKGSFYSQDIWTLKYLPKFKWHHLTQKLAHDQRLKKQQLKMQMDQQRKMQQFYTTQMHKSKTISGIIKKKIEKGKQIKETKQRIFGQKSTIQQQRD